VFAAPSARRLARELDVDIERVQGSGPGGRVTEADVRAAAERTTGPHETSEAVEESDGALGEQAAREEGEVTSAVRRAGEGGVESKLGRETEPPERGRTLATPATRKLARELGVDLDRIPASGERDGGAFVTESDVRSFAETQAAAEESGAAGAKGAEAGAAEAETAEAETPTERVETVPYRGIRRTIGKQMEESAFTAPHVTHHDEVDVTELVETRTRLRERAEERGSSLTYVPFVVRAVVAALAEHPFLNSELDEEAEEILLKRYYNVGIATATDAGLMVPVVEDADEKSLLELADEIEELVGRARDRSIEREEMQGGTFTVTNFGAVGGEYATPIINYPETAILGLGAITEKPRVVEREDDDGVLGDSDGKEVVPRKVLTLSLSIDHRVVDGAVAARFVNTVKEYLEDPSLLLLE